MKPEETGAQHSVRMYKLLYQRIRRVRQQIIIWHVKPPEVCLVRDPENQMVTLPVKWRQYVDSLSLSAHTHIPAIILYHIQPRQRQTGILRQRLPSQILHIAWTESLDYAGWQKSICPLNPEAQKLICNKIHIERPPHTIFQQIATFIAVPENIAQHAHPVREINLVGIYLHRIFITDFRQRIIIVIAKQPGVVIGQSRCIVVFLFCQIHRIDLMPVFKHLDFVRILHTFLLDQDRSVIRTVIIHYDKLVQGINT